VIDVNTSCLPERSPTATLAKWAYYHHHHCYRYTSGLLSVSNSCMQPSVTILEGYSTSQTHAFKINYADVAVVVAAAMKERYC
jgi:hypothetical protein